MIDLREFAGGIETQGWSGPCVANAVVSAIEIVLAQKDVVIDLSRLFLYYTGREGTETLDRDGMVTVYNALWAASTWGIPDEELWGYGFESRNVRPSDEAYADAALQKLTDYKWLMFDKSFLGEQIRLSLDGGNPVVISMPVGELIYGMPADREAQLERYVPVGIENPLSGYHAVTVIGYDDDVFLVENSWSDAWGDNGYWWMHESILVDVTEAWAILDFDILQPRRDVGVYLSGLSGDMFTIDVVTDGIINVWIGAFWNDKWWINDGRWHELVYPWDLNPLAVNVGRDMTLDASGGLIDFFPYAGAEVYAAFGEQASDWTVVEIVTIGVETI